MTMYESAQDDCTELPGGQAKDLLEVLSTWGATTTIVLHGGCVFEFKGVFPTGSIGEGYYNLKEGWNGFSGHIRLDTITHIRFQERPHRGRDSYAFCFCDEKGEVIFKVFLGRDDAGAVYADQLSAWRRIRQQLADSGRWQPLEK